MSMLTAESPGVLSAFGQDFTGKTVVLRASSLGARYQKPQFQLFRVTGGFGADPAKSGGKIYGFYLADKSESQLRREDVCGIPEPALTEKVLAVKAEPIPIDLTQRVYMVVNCNKMTFFKNVELGAALKAAKCKFPSKGVLVYRCHPEAVVNDMFGINFPDGTTCDEIK